MTFTNKKRKNSSTKAKLTNSSLEKRFGKVAVPRSFLIITLICVHYKSADAVFIERPKNAIVIVNHSTFFNCSKFSNTSKEPTWYHHPLDGTRREVYDYKKIIDKYKDRFNIDKNIASGTFNLLVLRPEKTDAGRYECVVEGDEEEDPGASAELTLLDSNLVCESDQDLNDVVGPTECANPIAPDQLQLSCSVTYNGNVAPQMHWRKAGNALESVGIHNCGVRGNRVMCNATLEANFNMDGSVYVCQVVTAEQYNCSLNVNKIMHTFSDTSVRAITTTDEAFCSANTSKDLPCSYKWFKDNKTEQLGQTLKPSNPGIYSCEAECKIRNETCAFTAMVINVSESAITGPGNLRLLGLLVLIILLGGIVAGLVYYFRKKSVTKNQLTFKEPPALLMETTPDGPAYSQLEPSSLKSGPEYSQLELSSLKSGPAYSQLEPSSLNSGPAYSQLEPSSLNSGPVYSQLEPSSLNSGPAYSQLEPSSLNSGPAYSQLEPSTLNSGPAYSQLEPSAELRSSLPTITDQDMVETVTINQYFIDRGTSGAIYGPFRWKDKKCAIKQILYSPDKLTEETREKITQLRDRSRELDQPHLVKVFEVWFPSPALYIVMEYAEGKSLDKILRPKDASTPLLPFPLEIVLAWALQVADGMRYLHEKHLVHRNLKAAHVLVMELPDFSPNTLKIGSYTLAKEHDHSTVMSLKGTMAWMAPEYIRGEKFSTLSDVWSYGVTVWEILTRDVPYKEVRKETDIVRAAMSKTLKLKIPESCPEPLQDLLKECWNYEVNERPSFEKICDHLRARVQESCVQ